MKQLPVGESDFKQIRTKDLLYVDKTEDIYRLITTGKYYFLSRPRRFGKSLLVSTLRELFLGHKDLFKDLWIYDKIAWNKHPVISFSFNNIDYKKQGLEKSLHYTLDKQADLYNIQLKNATAKEKFSELILTLGQQGQVVILIDEYDKPILDYLHDVKQADDNRDTLKNFFGVLKGLDIVGKLELVFLTGVSKFSRVSIFSELNNLTDLTAHSKYTTMLGMTQQELETDFAPYIDMLVQSMKLSKSALLANIKKWYNGYTWDAENFVYNPHSLLHLFHTGKFENFWFQSGTTSWLVKNMRYNQIKLTGLENKMVLSSFFDKFSLDNLDPIVLLYQTGYLTIKSIDTTKTRHRYYLSYPNYEVRTSFLENLFQEYAQKRVSEIGETLLQIEEALLNNDMQAFVAFFKTVFADISNRLLKQYITQNIPELWEAYYHSVIYIALSLVATDSRIDAEVQTNKGYTDLTAETADYVYVIEFKIGTAATAMQQIKTQQYYQKYQQLGKKIILVGIGFSVAERNIDSCLVEEI